MAKVLRPSYWVLSTALIVFAGSVTGCSQQAEDFVRMSRDKMSGLVPSLSLSPSGSDSLIESTNASNFTIGGTCSANGQAVKITGSASANSTCSNNTWTAVIDASTLSDGLLSFVAHHQDASGREAPAVSITVPKDSGPPAYASFSKSAARVTESNTSTSFTIQLSAAKPYDTAINYFVSGSAATGVDHTLAAGSVTVPAGQTSAVVNYDLLNNGAAQNERRLMIGLASPNKKNVLIGAISQQTVDIADDDSGAYNTVLSYSVTSDYTCVVFANNKLKCWGSNSYGQVGDGTITARTTPMAIDAAASYTQIVTGAGPSTCGLQTSGVVKCWGWNGAGQLGDGTTTQRLSPTVSNGGLTFSSISGGTGAHRCGITTANKLRCWGSNGFGQLGNGTTTSSSGGVAIDAAADYAQVSIGYNHTCGVTTAGVLKCWGSNAYGQLGDGTTTQRLTPVVIDSGTTYATTSGSVAASSNATCAITTAGDLKCWGQNANSEVGDGTTTQRNSPVAIDSGTSYASVSGSKQLTGTTCGITTTGVLKCWGSNANALIGDGTKITRALPTAIDAGTTYASISVGYFHSCALTTNGIFKCWGTANTYGQIQPYAVDAETLPVAVDSTLTYTKFSQAAGHACGILANGKIRCWGSNASGQLGDGTTFDRALPVNIEPTSSIQYNAITAGNSHTCALSTSGAIQCWGANNKGQLGDGTTTQRLSPVTIDSNVVYSSLSIGDDSTCGVTSAGVLKCWGNNSNGQLGDGTTTQRNSPVVVDSGTTYKTISVGGTHACGITSADVLKCWGGNTWGQVGDGTTTQRLTPVVINAGVSYSTVSAASVSFFTSTCAITTAGVLKCWGENSGGQIGDGTTTQRNSPVVVDSGTTYVKTATTAYTGCGITTTGVLKCWGGNIKSSLGDGTTTQRNSPVVINAGVSYSAIFPNAWTACGLTTAGALKCWGENVSGIFARGDQSLVPLPVARLLEP